jgi:pyruvate formate lyase activating enzyme
MKEAMFYKSLDGKLKCNLCNHYCTIKEGKKGICGVRKNINAKLYSLVYGKSIATDIDPIDKKPFLIFILVQQLIQLLLLAVISTALTVRIGKYLRR